MREMIRNIEDSQTEQALHGLLSLNADSNSPSSSPAVLSPSAMPASAAASVSSSTVVLPGNSSMSPTSPVLGDPASQSSMAALSMLLKQRSSVGPLIGQPMVASDLHRQTLQLTASSAERGSEAGQGQDGGREEEKPLMLKVERVSEREKAPSPHPARSAALMSDLHLPSVSSTALPSSPSSSSAAVTLMSMVAATSGNRSEGKVESVVGSMLRAPPQLQYTLTGPPFLLKTEAVGSAALSVKKEGGAPSHTVLSTTLLPNTLAAAASASASSSKQHQLSPMSQLPLPLHAQPSVIVQNATLDLRKKSDEQISRSPIKKRPYIPSSMSEEEAEGDSGGDSSPRPLPEVPPPKQRRSSRPELQEPSQSSEVFSGARSPDSYSGRHNALKTALRPTLALSESSAAVPLSVMAAKTRSPLPSSTSPLPSSSTASSSSSPSTAMSIAKKHEEEAKLTVPYMISRLHESYNATFTFLKARLGEMKQKLRDYKHQNTMERMIGRIISQNLSSPENVVRGLHVPSFVSVELSCLYDTCILAARCNFCVDMYLRK